VTKRKRTVEKPETKANTNIASANLRPLESTDWPLVEQLFGSNGACGGCWCMHWRVERGGKAWDNLKGDANRRSLKALVETGEVYAILASLGDLPVGWCSFGPTTSFPRLMNSRALARPRSDGVWSIICFYIPSKYRRLGLATRLLAAAKERAFALGASEVEGFPVNPQSSETPVPAAFAWTGVTDMFAAAGFQPVRRPDQARVIYASTQPTGAGEAPGVAQ
jgi:GNAT superfamily N-acetyltransferase